MIDYIPPPAIYEQNCIVHAPTPDWVNPALLPKDSDWDTLLRDEQFDRKSKSHYFHIAYEIHNEKPNLQIPFHPFFEKIVLHSCDVIREGRKIDRLFDAQIHVIQQEPELDINIYSGNMSLVLFLNDLQEGDILEYSYSIRGCPFERLGSRLPLQFTDSVGIIHYRILKSGKNPLQIQLFNSQNCTIADNETEEEYVLTAERCPAYHREPDQPKGYDDQPCLQLSEYASWKDYAEEHLDLYYRLFDPDFALDPEACNLVSEWKRRSLTQEDAALKALRFVQDEIRYLAVYIEDGGWNPANPRETLRRRYGDCKGKTQLFRAFLDMLGIPSTPVLVNQYQEEIIQRYLPQCRFGHLITRINLPDGPVYVDPTLTHQGGSLQESYMTYRVGLNLDKNSEEFSSIPVKRPEIDSEQAISFTKKSGGVEMTLTNQYYGTWANFIRERLSVVDGKKKCAEYLRDLYADRYGKTKLLSYEARDDRDANCLTATVTLFFENPWNQNEEGEKFFNYANRFFLFYFLQEIDLDRKTPLRLPLPERIRETIEFPDGSLRMFSSTVEHSAFAFSSEKVSEQKAVFELNSHLDRLEPDALKEYAKELDHGRQASFVTLYELPEETRYALRIAKLLSQP